jgi:hypothetical protein
MTRSSAAAAILVLALASFTSGRAQDPEDAYKTTTEPAQPKKYPGEAYDKGGSNVFLTIFYYRIV